MSGDSAVVQGTALGYYDMQVSDFSGNTSLDCYAMVERYRRGDWLIPDFQRYPLLWPISQRCAFIDRLRLGPAPIGAIVVFQSMDDPGRKTYILDGLQRVSTMAEFLSSPDMYNESDLEIVERLLMQQEFPVQRRLYRTRWEAYADFVRLQKNLPLTSFEQFLGQRSLRQQWEWFGPIEGETHRYIDGVMASYGIRAEVDRNHMHAYWRHNLGMWLRFATKETRLEPWSVTNQKKPVEDRLGELLGLSKVKVERMTREFRARLDNDSEIIRNAWSAGRRALGLPEEQRAETTLLRWLQECGVYADANGVNKVRFKQFCEQVFLVSGGRAQISYKRSDSTDDRITLGLGRLQRIGDLVRRRRDVTEDIRTPDGKPDKDNGSFPIGRGQDRCHEQPRSLYGPGPTSPGSAAINRSKGARP